MRPLLIVYCFQKARAPTRFEFIGTVWDRRLSIEKIVIILRQNGLSIVARLSRSHPRPMQRRFLQHGLALVPAFSAIDEPIGPIRPRICRPLGAALFGLRWCC